MAGYVQPTLWQHSLRTWDELRLAATVLLRPRPGYRRPCGCESDPVVFGHLCRYSVSRYVRPS